MKAAPICLAFLVLMALAGDARAEEPRWDEVTALKVTVVTGWPHAAPALLVKAPHHSPI